MTVTRDDVIREAAALRDLARQVVARADALVTMAASLPAIAGDSDAWQCPVDHCRVPLHARNLGDHLRNVHPAGTYEAWIVRHPEHALELAVDAP